MPISKEKRKRYPLDWDKLSLIVRREAGYKCERCQVTNHAWGFRDSDGEFHEVDRQSFPPDTRPPMWHAIGPKQRKERIIRIVLTVAHLDHDPANNSRQNLQAMCQKCHLTYDAAFHQANAAKTRRAKLSTPDLFDQESLPP